MKYSLQIGCKFFLPNQFYKSYWLVIHEYRLNLPRSFSIFLVSLYLFHLFGSSFHCSFFSFSLDSMNDGFSPLKCCFCNYLISFNGNFNDINLFLFCYLFNVTFTSLCSSSSIFFAQSMLYSLLSKMHRLCRHKLAMTIFDTF